jgi:hypothetical protein
MSGQGPVAASNRIEGIDVLRGLALFGVVAIHVVLEFRVSIFEQFLPTPDKIPSSTERYRVAANQGVESSARSQICRISRSDDGTSCSRIGCWWKLSPKNMEAEGEPGRFSCEFGQEPNCTELI